MPTMIDIHTDGLHTGHKFALYKHGRKYDYKPNEITRWLWRKWCLMLDQIQEIIDEVKPEHVHFTLLGEAADIDAKSRNGGEYWTTDPIIAVDNACEILEGIAGLVDSAHFCVGTKAHVGKERATTDELVARNFLKTPMNPSGFTVPRSAAFASWNNAEYVLAGVRFNVQHYGKNRSKWGRNNLINSLRDEIVLKRHEAGEPVPDVVGRGHWHWCGRTDPDERPIVAQTPSWQIDPDYIFQRKPFYEPPVVGAWVYICRDGEVEMRRLTYRFPRRPTWHPPK